MDRCFRRRHGMGQDRDEGAIGILAVGLCIILLMLSVTVIAVTSVYIEQRKLQLLADQCADAATSRLAGFDAEGNAPTASLTPGGVAEATGEVLAAVPPGIDAVAIEPGTGSDGRNTARVRLSAVAHPPLVGVFVPEGVPISAESSARVILTQ